MHSVAQNDACASVMNDESPDRHGRGFRRVSNISVHDNTDTRILDEEVVERRKAIHEFLMLNHTDTEVQE